MDAAVLLQVACWEAGNLSLRTKEIFFQPIFKRQDEKCLLQMELEAVLSVWFCFTV